MALRVEASRRVKGAVVAALNAEASLHGKRDEAVEMRGANEKSASKTRKINDIGT